MQSKLNNENTRFRVKVGELISSRYSDGKRPESWDQRVSGVDIIKSTEGQELKLNSSGQQSPPKPGWILEVFSGSQNAGYEWTLYGIPPKN